MAANSNFKNDLSSDEKKQDLAAHADPIRKMEHQLKLLWDEYVQNLEKNGLNERTKALREKYFQHYREYRLKRIWKKAIADI